MWKTKTKTATTTKHVPNICMGLVGKNEIFSMTTALIYLMLLIITAFRGIRTQESFPRIIQAEFSFSNLFNFIITLVSWENMFR